MGDTTDMMLDGTLCEGCGVFMGEPCDFPRLCHDCARERRDDGHSVEYLKGFGHVDSGIDKKAKPTPKKTACAVCQKRVKEIGMKDHVRDAHGVKS